MQEKKSKKPNAVKHGVFSAIAILPGEHLEEFEELVSSLIEEWMPVGASEHDAVASIANAMWRKRRLQTFVNVQLLKNNMNPDHPSYDEAFGLHNFGVFMTDAPHTAFEVHATRTLRPDRIKYFREKFPRENFDSDSEWTQAIRIEIYSVLLPQWKEMHPLLDDIGRLIGVAATISGEAFLQEVALDERLDAMIDRAVKRLMQIKTMKSMLADASAGYACDKSSKMIASNPAK